MLTKNNIQRSGSWTASRLEYKTLGGGSGSEFLIELPGDKKKDFDKTGLKWSVVSETKQFIRYHTPEVVAHYRGLQRHREELALACNNAWLEFLDDVARSHAQFRSVVDKLAIFDALNALAAVGTQLGWVCPEIVETADGSSVLEIDDGRHPMVEALLADMYVPNSIELGADHERCMLITGPNMGGKSSYIRQVGAAHHWPV